MAPENPIGEYLRARRELVRPEDVDLPDLGSRRRVPGLRREEVAMLAGVSADYYVRLEQGRDQHPSEQVIDALGRALQLDDDAVAHLRRLGRPRAPASPPAAAGRAGPAGILELIDSLHETPAYVYGRYMDVLAANLLATALVAYYRRRGQPGPRRLPRPAGRETHGDWERVTESTVASLRALDRARRRRPAAGGAGRRAVGALRALPPTLGPPRRQAEALRPQPASTTPRSVRSTSATRSCRSPTPTG